MNAEEVSKIIAHADSSAWDALQYNVWLNTYNNVALNVRRDVERSVEDNVWRNVRRVTFQAVRASVYAHNK